MKVGVGDYRQPESSGLRAVGGFGVTALTKTRHRRHNNGAHPGASPTLKYKAKEDKYSQNTRRGCIRMSKNSQQKY